MDERRSLLFKLLLLFEFADDLMPYLLMGAILPFCKPKVKRFCGEFLNRLFDFSGVLYFRRVWF